MEKLLAELLVKNLSHFIFSYEGNQIELRFKGGYTTGPKEIVDFLRQRSRPYLFSNTLPPPVVASASKALDLITKDSTLPSKVAENTARFRTKMKALGFTISVNF